MKTAIPALAVLTPAEKLQLIAELISVFFIEQKKNIK